MFCLQHSRQEIGTQWALTKVMFRFPFLQIFFFQKEMKWALAERAGQWEMETVGNLKAESNESI